MSSIMWLWLLSVGLAAIGLVVITKWQRLARLGGELITGLLLASLVLIVAAPFSWPLAVLAFALHAWLLLLPARLLMGRLEPQFLQRSTRQHAVLVVAGAVL